MSFLNNGSSPRMAPKGTNSQDRSLRPERDSGESPFSADMLQSEPAEPISTRPASTFSAERPSFSASSAPVNSAGPTPAEKCTNVIAAGASWQGNLNVEDSVRIDGKFSGEIDAKGTVHVAEGAQVDAKVRAGYVVISGEFRGEIRCEQRVDLMPRSRVNGEVITKVLSVHEGATIDGSVKMSGNLESETRRGSSRVGRNGAEERERVAAGSVGNGSRVIGEE